MVVIIIVVLHESCGIPFSSQTQSPAADSKHVRVKRCSCNSWDDKECIYFCHLDIIWVNTPSKVLPYGLGSPLSRRRRSIYRCHCADRHDTTCSAYCYKRSENPKIDVTKSVEKSSRLSNNKLLQSLRYVVKSNTKKLASAEKHAKVKQLRNTMIRWKKLPPCAVNGKVSASVGMVAPSCGNVNGYKGYAKTFKISSLARQKQQEENVGDFLWTFQIIKKELKKDRNNNNRQDGRRNRN